MEIFPVYCWLILCPAKRAFNGTFISSVIDQQSLERTGGWRSPPDTSARCSHSLLSFRHLCCSTSRSGLIAVLSSAVRFTTRDSKFYIDCDFKLVNNFVISRSLACYLQMNGTRFLRCKQERPSAVGSSTLQL